MVLRTLGGLALEGAVFRRPRPLLLLAYLALEGPTERRRLAELPWMNAADPRHSLATALTQLRRGAPGAVEDDGVRLWTPLACDAAALRRASDPGALLAAFEAYRGPFLEGAEPPDAGIELEEWIWSAREALAARAREALLLQAGRDAAAGEFARAAARAERALTLVAAPEPDPELLARLHALLLAGDHPRSGEVAAEARALGATVAASVEDARKLALRTAPSGASALPLPRHGTSFVGRTRELAELAALAARPAVRLVTVLGAGGAGKSRLALQHARAAGERYARMGFVALDALETAAAIPGAAAAALGVALGGAEPAEALARAVGTERTLLIFDNFEHLLGGAPLLSGLLARCPGLDLLTTSRERLAAAPPADLHFVLRVPNDFLERRGRYVEARELFGGLAARLAALPVDEPGRDSALAAARVCGAWACLRLGRDRESRELMTRGLERVSLAAAPFAALLGHNGLGALDYHEGAFAESKRRREELAAHIREVEERHLLPARLASLARASNTANTADAEVALGEYEAAARHYREAAELHERLGRRTAAADNLVDLGYTLACLGRFEEAAALLRLVLHHPNAEHLVWTRAERALERARRFVAREGRGGRPAGSGGRDRRAGGAGTAIAGPAAPAFR